MMVLKLTVLLCRSAGLGDIKGICSDRSATICVDWNQNQATQTGAHELGHRSAANYNTLKLMLKIQPVFPLYHHHHHDHMTAFLSKYIMTDKHGPIHVATSCHQVRCKGWG